MIKVTINVHEIQTMDGQPKLEELGDILERVATNVRGGDTYGTCDNYFNRRCGNWSVEGSVDDT